MPADLQRLARIAQADRKDFFKRYPRWSALYSKRLLCVALPPIAESSRGGSPRDLEVVGVYGARCLWTNAHSFMAS
jgi:hypothetical protein